MNCLIVANPFLSPFKNECSDNGYCKKENAHTKKFSEIRISEEKQNYNQLPSLSLLTKIKRNFKKKVSRRRIITFDYKNKNFSFPIYEDRDIFTSSPFSNKLKINKNDDDIESDTEIIELAIKKMEKEVQYAIIKQQQDKNQI